jgi:hypothetical protein
MQTFIELFMQPPEIGSTKHLKLFILSGGTVDEYMKLYT